jgi:hypothetical protein
MKTSILTVVLALFYVTALKSQDQAFQKGQKDLNIGIGLGNTLVDGPAYNVWPPLSLSLDYGVTDDISVGGYFGFTGASDRYTGWENYGPGNGGGYYTDTYRWTYFILGVRGAYHFGKFIKVPKLDTYAGLMLGYDFAHYSYSTNSPNPDHVDNSYATYGGFAFSIYGGARYRFNEKIAGFAELGYGVSWFTLGVNFRLQ